MEMEVTMSNLSFKEDLKQNANSLHDVFNIANKHFDTTAKMGTISKGVLIANIDKIISLAGVKPKK